MIAFFLLKLLHFSTIQIITRYSSNKNHRVKCVWIWTRKNSVFGHFSCIERYNIVIIRLRHDFAIISEWFYENYIVLNAGKYNFLTIGFNEQFPDFSFNDTTIENANKKILGIVIDNKLNFKSQLKNICIKANQKLSALSSISKLTTFNQREKFSRLIKGNIFFD